MELYRKYRPKKLSDVIGQPEAVRALESKLRDGSLPHALMLAGPSGCGKTTLARIIRRELGCGKQDYVETNAASSRGIDAIREVERNMTLAPMNGPCRMWVFDEAHQLTRKQGGDAQTALLKLLEDTPEHVYFVLCTTDPERLLRTIHTRCTPLRLNRLTDKDLEGLIAKVLREEKAVLTPGVLRELVAAADGSARMALVLLEKVLGLKDEAEQLATIMKADAKKAGIDLARALINPKSKWPDVARLLGQLDGDSEEIRRTVLSYGSKVVLGGGPQQAKAFLILDCFAADTYGTGKAGIVKAAYEVYREKE